MTVRWQPGDSGHVQRGHRFLAAEGDRLGAAGLDYVTKSGSSVTGTSSGPARRPGSDADPGRLHLVTNGLEAAALAAKASWERFQGEVCPSYCERVAPEWRNALPLNSRSLRARMGKVSPEPFACVVDSLQ